MSATLMLPKAVPAPKRLQAIGSKLADEQQRIRELEAELRTRRARRGELVLKLTGRGVAERAIASLVGVHGKRVDEWKHRAAGDGAAKASAPSQNGTGPAQPITAEDYYLVHQLFGERLAASELRDLVTARSTQARVSALQSLLARGWVQCVDGIYSATARARKAVSW
jgi:hypothetical protein